MLLCKAPAAKGIGIVFFIFLSKCAAIQEGVVPGSDVGPQEAFLEADPGNELVASGVNRVKKAAESAVITAESALTSEDQNAPSAKKVLSRSERVTDMANALPSEEESNNFDVDAEQINGADSNKAKRWRFFGSKRDPAPATMTASNTVSQQTTGNRVHDSSTEDYATSDEVEYDEDQDTEPFPTVSPNFRPGPHYLQHVHDNRRPLTGIPYSNYLRTSYLDRHTGGRRLLEDLVTELAEKKRVQDSEAAHGTDHSIGLQTVDQPDKFTYPQSPVDYTKHFDTSMVQPGGTTTSTDGYYPAPVTRRPAVYQKGPVMSGPPYGRPNAYGAIASGRLYQPRGRGQMIGSQVGYPGQVRYNQMRYEPTIIRQQQIMRDWRPQQPAAANNQQWQHPSPQSPAGVSARFRNRKRPLLNQGRFVRPVGAVIRPHLRGVAPRTRTNVASQASSIFSTPDFPSSAEVRNRKVMDDFYEMNEATSQPFDPRLINDADADDDASTHDTPDVVWKADTKQFHAEETETNPKFFWDGRHGRVYNPREVPRTSNEQHQSGEVRPASDEGDSQPLGKRDSISKTAEAESDTNKQNGFGKSNEKSPETN